MRGWDARSGRAVQLCELRGAGSKGSSVASDPRIVDEALAALSPEFEKLYAKSGRPSIPPERLLRALLLQAFYSVRSERQLMEQLDYNLLFRWFVGLSMDDAIWDVTVFTKNRERLLDGRHRRQVHGGGARPGSGQGAAVGRSFLGRRHADRGVGQHEELSSRRTAAASRRHRVVMASATFTARSAATRPTPRPPIPMPGCIVRGPASRPSWPIWATF